MKGRSSSRSLVSAVRRWLFGATALMCLSTTGFGRPQTNAPCCASAEAPAAALGDKSLYQIDSKWTTDTEKEIKLAELKGRPQVVVMFFASCQSACPILVHDLERIEASLMPEQRARVGFTLVTIDPSRDTPQALGNYRAARGLPADTWTLLRGEPDDIRELAALLGMKYKKQANGQFAHSNLITVLNQEGEIVHQLAGQGRNVKATVNVINELIADSSALNGGNKE